MSCSTLTMFEVIAIGPSTTRRVLTVMADDGQDAIDRLYRSEQLHDDEIPVTCRPAGHRITPPLLCGAPQPDGTVIVSSMTRQQRRQLYRWLALSAALPMTALLLLHWLIG